MKPSSIKKLEGLPQDNDETLGKMKVMRMQASAVKLVPSSTKQADQTTLSAMSSTSMSNSTVFPPQKNLLCPQTGEKIAPRKIKLAGGNIKMLSSKKNENGMVNGVMNATSNIPIKIPNGNLNINPPKIVKMLNED